MIDRYTPKMILNSHFGILLGADLKALLVALLLTLGATTVFAAVPTVSTPGPQTIQSGDFLLLTGGTAITIADGDTDSQTVTITVSGSGTLLLDDAPTIVGGANGTDGMVFTGTLSAVNANMDGAIYDPNGSLGIQTISVSTDDGNGGMDIATLTITVNSAPVVALPVDQTIGDTQTFVFALANSVTVADVDDDALQMTITVSGGGKLDLQALGSLVGTGDNSSALNYTGSVADWNTALLNAEFSPEMTPGVHTLTFEVSDGNGGSAGPIAMTITVQTSLTITEIMYDPNSTEPDWEWIEIFNNASFTYDLTGYVLDDFNGSSHGTFNIASGTIPSGTSAILFNNSLLTSDFEASWGTGINLIEVSGWGANGLNNAAGDRVGLWRNHIEYVGDHNIHSNAIISVAYPDVASEGVSIFLSQTTPGSEGAGTWAASADGLATPVNTGDTNLATNLNLGGEIASPGGVIVANTPTFSVTWLDDSGDGNIDQMKVDFSEGVKFTDGTPSDVFDAFDLSSGTITSSADFSLVTNTTTFTFDISGLTGTEDPGVTVTYKTGRDNSILSFSASLEVDTDDTETSSSDGAGPAVTSVDIPAADTYILGEDLGFTVHFGEAVDVTGTPEIALTIGGSSEAATYQSGDGTADLTFTYSIGLGDLDVDGIAVGALTDGGGTLEDVSGNTATLTLNGLPATGGVLVDAVIPTVSSVSVPAANTYTIGDPLDFVVTFDDNIVVTGTPTLNIDIGGNSEQASYQSGSGSAALSFRYSVIAGDEDLDGIGITSLTNGGGTLEDISGNTATLTLNGISDPSVVRVDAVGPVVTSVIEPSDDTYAINETLDFTINFDETVNVIGTPFLNITIGASPEQATYQSGDGTNTLLFQYTVVLGDEDTDGIAIGTLVDGGGNIEDVFGNTATFTLNGVDPTTNVDVDGVLPTFVDATYYDIDGNGDIDEILLEMSEPVNEGSAEIEDFIIDAGSITSFTVTVGGSGGNGVDTSTSDQYITLEVNIPGTADVSIVYNQDDANLELSDLAGNEAADDGGISTIDLAPPVLTFMRIEDTDDNGHIDKVVYVFSESGVVPEDGTEGTNDIGTITLPDNSTASGIQNGDVSYADVGSTTEVTMLTIDNSTVNTSAGSAGTTGVDGQWEDDGGLLSIGDDSEQIDDKAAPVITDATIALNQYVDVTFSEPVYGNAAANNAVTEPNFDLSFSSGLLVGLTVDDVNSNTVTNVGEPSSLGMGGQSIIRVFFSFTGTAAGGETMDVDTNGSIYDDSNNTAAVAQFPTNNQDQMAATQIPSMVSAEWQDNDGNGSIDQVEIYFDIDWDIDELTGDDSADGLDCFDIKNGATLITQDLVDYDNVDNGFNDAVDPLVITFAGDQIARTDIASLTITYTTAGTDAIQSKDTQDDMINGSTPSVYLDGAAPHFNNNFSATILDNNIDGNVDQIVVTTLDDIDDNVIDPSDFTYNGIQATGVTNLNNSDQQFTLVVNGSGTAVEGDLVYSGVSLADVSGNSSTTGTIVASSISDDADPVILSATTKDIDLNGEIDRIAIVFSETVSDLGAVAGDFTLGSSYTASSVSIGASTATLTLNESGSFDTFVTPTVTIAASTVEDLAGIDNPLQAFGAAADGAAPYARVDDQTGGNSTQDTSPEITGTIDDASASVLVAVDGNVLFATNNSPAPGQWTLPDNSFTASGIGDFEVVLTTIDPSGNVGTDIPGPELTIDGGIDITAATPVFVACIGDDYAPLGQIGMQETGNGDFGSTGTLILLLPSGFEFNTSQPASFSGTLTDISVTSSFLGTGAVRLNITVTGSTALDNLLIDDLEVKAVGPVETNVVLERSGGTAAVLTTDTDYAILTSLASEAVITDVDVDGSVVTEYATSFKGTLVVTYDNGHLPTFSDGEDFTFSGGSVGEMVPGSDNGSSMTVFLTTGTTIGVNESFTGGISGNTSTVSVATTAGVPYLKPFTITVDEGGYDAEWYDDAGSPIVIASGGATTTNVELGATSPGLYSYDITIDNGTCENQPFRFNVLIYDDTDGDGVDTFFDRNFISDNPAVTLNFSKPTNHTVLIYGDGITVTNPTTDPIVVTFDPALAFDPNVQTTINEITYSVTNNNTGEQIIETANFTVDKPTQIFSTDVLPLDMCASEFPRSFTLSTAGLSPGQSINYIYFRNTTLGGSSEYWYRFASEFGTYPTGPYTFDLDPGPDNIDSFTSWPVFSGTSIQVEDGSAVALYVERGLTNPSAFSQENIFVYGDPIVELTNIDDVYCGDDEPITLQRTATYVTGFDSNSSSPNATYKPIVETETMDISTGYILLKADPTVTPASGGPYGTSHTAQTPVVVALTDGEYDFNLFDSFGDGILSPGTFVITDNLGTVIFSLAGNPAYSSLSETFCIGGDPGCFQSPITVNITTDQYPSEITWEILEGATYSFYADFTSSMTSTFYPSDPDQDGDDYTVEDESGDYRIVYTSEGLTPTGTCTGNAFFDVTINSIPEIGNLLSPLETGNVFPFQNYNSYPTLIGDVWLETVDNSADYNGNDSYFVEYYGVNAVTSSGYLLANESQSRYNWYREDMSPIVVDGSWALYYTAAYDNPATPILDPPEAGKTYDFYFARVADGCEGELRKLTVYIYEETASPKLDATWVSGLDPLVSNAVEMTTNHYQVEYCDSYIPIELDGPDASGSVPTSRNPSAYYKIYSSNPDGSIGAFLADHNSSTLNATDVGLSAGTGTVTVYVSQVWNDQTPASAATDVLPYEGGEGPATRFDITVYGSPSAPTLLGDFPTLSSLDLQICEGEIFTSFVNTASGINEYIWYAPDMTTELKRVSGGATLNASDLQPTIYYDKDVPGEYVFYVSRISNRNVDTGFNGCESSLTQVTISVHPISDEASVSSVDYVDEEPDPIDVTYSVCILDYSVSDVLSASSTYSSAPFVGDEKVFLWYSANSSGVSQTLTYTGESPTFGNLGMTGISSAETRYYNVVQRTDNSYFDDAVGCDSPPAFVTINFKVADDFYFKSEVVPSTTYVLYNSGAQFCHDDADFVLTPSLSTSTSDADFISSGSYTYTLFEGGTNTIVEVASTPITGSSPLAMTLDDFHFASGGTDTGGSPTDFDLSIDYFDPIAECTRNKVFSFTINPQPVATFLIEEKDYENDVLYPDAIEVCYDDGVLDLEGVFPNSGTFDPLANLSGNLFTSPSGAIGNLGNNKANFAITTAHPSPFAPEAAYSVSFTYTDLLGCDIELNKTIIVKPRPKPSGVQGTSQIQFDQVCKESDAVGDPENEIIAFIEMLDPSDGVTPIIDYTGYNFDWTVNGSLVGSMSNTNNISFDESANNLNFSVVVTNPEGCQVTVVEGHIKQDLPNLTIDGIVNNQQICSSDSDKTLTLKDGVVDAASSTISWSVVSYDTDSGIGSATETFSGSGSNPTIDIHGWHEAAGGNMENLDGDIVGGPSTIHTITMIYQDNTRSYQGAFTQCSNIIERTIQINPLPDISFDVEFLNELEVGYNETFCYDYGLISLQGIFADGSDLTGGSGSFSGSGVIPTGNSLATWNPVSAHGSNAHKVQTGYDVTFTYTDPNGCQYAVTKTLNVDPLPDPVEFGPGNDQIQFSQICVESPIVAFVELDGVSDYSNYSFVWDLPGDASGPVQVANQITYNSAITNASADHNFDIGVVITNSLTGCSFSIDENHDQQELPEIIFSMVSNGGEYCQEEETLQMAVFTDSGEIGVAGTTDINNLSYSVTSVLGSMSRTFSGSGNPLIDFQAWHTHADVGGLITGGSPTTHTITMTYLDEDDNTYQGIASNCTNSRSITITIHPDPDLSFEVNDVDIFDAGFVGVAGDNSADEFCYDDDLVDLDGAFGALTAGRGYNLGLGNGQFTSTTPGAIILTGSNNNALFDPEAAHGSDPHAPRSQHIIRFTYTDENGCQNYVEKDIFVNPLPDPIEVAVGNEAGDQIKFTEICEGSPITAYVELDGVSDYSDYTFAWDLPNDAMSVQASAGSSVTTSGGVVSITGSSNANFITYSSVTVDFSIDVTITRGTTGCAIFISEDHVQQPLPDLDFTIISNGDSYCQEDTDLALAMSTNTGTIGGSDLTNLSYSVTSNGSLSKTFSGSGNPIIDFDVWHSDVGGSVVGGSSTTHTITMTYQDLSNNKYQDNFSNCTNTVQATILIYPKPTLSFSYEQAAESVDNEVCIDEGRLTLVSSLPEQTGQSISTFSVADFSSSALEDNNNGTAHIAIEQLFLDAISAGVLDDSGATASRSSRSVTVDIDLFFEDEITCTNIVTQSVVIHNLPVPEYDITQNGSSLVVGTLVEVCIDDLSVIDAAAIDKILLIDITDQVIQGSRTSASFVENNYNLGATSLENIGTSGQAYFYPRAAVQAAEVANSTLAGATSIDFVFDMSYTNEFGCVGKTKSSDAEAGVQDFDNRLTIRVYRTPKPIVKVDVAGFARTESDYCIDQDVAADPIRLFVESIGFDTGSGSGGTFVSDPPLSTGLYGSVVNAGGFDEIYFDPALAYAEHPTANTDNGDVAVFEISYVYNTSDKLCANVPSTSVVTITVNPKPFVEFIVDTGVGVATNEFCIDGDLEEIRGFAYDELAQTTDISEIGAGEFTTNFIGNPGVIPKSNNIADFNFQSAYDNNSERIHTVTYTYTKTETGCTNSTTQDIIVNTKPVIAIDAVGGCDKLPVDFVFSTIETAPGDGIATVLWNFDDDFAERDETLAESTDFAPTKTYANAGEYIPSLVATSNKGCTSLTVVEQVQIGDIPDVNFTVDGLCEGSDVTFVASPTSVDFGTVKSISFDFGDGSDLEFINTQGNPDNFTLRHTYTDPGVFDVRLVLTTNNDCQEIHERKISILPLETAPYFNDFNSAVPVTRDYIEEIFIESTELRKPTGGFENNVVIEADGWSVDFRPLDDKDMTDAGYWGKLPSDFNTWQFGIPTGLLINNTDVDHGNVWATNLDGNYIDNEVLSWVYSPCFDISSLQRPMVSFDKIYHFNDQRDGVVLQYSVDGGITWLVLGSIENGDASGTEWFTHSDISGFPGEQFKNLGGDARDYGWANNLDIDEETQFAEWTSSRHKLDEIEYDVRGVIFRFALGSNASDASEGFAFDNFSIDERKKNVLLEQFSTTNKEDSETVSDGINAVIDDITKNNGDVIVVNYHTSVKGDIDIDDYDATTNPAVLSNPDPISILNVEDPSARSVYYGIADVPNSVLDGQVGLGGSETGKTLTDILWTENDIARSSLEDEGFEIIIDDNFGSDEEILEISVKATAQTEINEGASTELALYIAIIEKDVEILDAVASHNGQEISRNALRKMLPNGIGSRFEQVFTVGTQINVSETWDITKDVDATDLAVVAFVQDVTSKTIYQTVIKDVVGKSSPTITGISDAFDNDGYSLYPNPANREVFVVFGKTTVEVMNWSVYDQTGKVYKLGKLRPGASGFSLQTHNFPSGMYFISMTGENLQLRPRKFIITH